MDAASANGRAGPGLRRPSQGPRRATWWNMALHSASRLSVRVWTAIAGTVCIILMLIVNTGLMNAWRTSANGGISFALSEAWPAGQFSKQELLSFAQEPIPKDLLADVQTESMAEDAEHLQPPFLVIIEDSSITPSVRISEAHKRLLSSSPASLSALAYTQGPASIVHISSGKSNNANLKYRMAQAVKQLDRGWIGSLLFAPSSLAGEIASSLQSKSKDAGKDDRTLLSHGANMHSIFDPDAMAKAYQMNHGVQSRVHSIVGSLLSKSTRNWLSRAVRAVDDAGMVLRFSNGQLFQAWGATNGWLAFPQAYTSETDSAKASTGGSRWMTVRFVTSDGCSGRVTGVEGSAAVLRPVSRCSFEQRAKNLQESGAKAVIFLGEGSAGTNYLPCSSCHFVDIIGAMLESQASMQLSSMSALADLKVEFLGLRFGSGIFALDSFSRIRSVGVMNSWLDVANELQHLTYLAGLRKQVAGIVQNSQAKEFSVDRFFGYDDYNLEQTRSKSCLDQGWCVIPVARRRTVGDGISLIDIDSSALQNIEEENWNFRDLDMFYSIECPAEMSFSHTSCGPWDYKMSLRIAVVEGEGNVVHEVELARIITAYGRGGMWVSSAPHGLPLLRIGRQASKSKRRLVLRVVNASQAYKLSILLALGIGEQSDPIPWQSASMLDSREWSGSLSTIQTNQDKLIWVGSDNDNTINRNYLASVHALYSGHGWGQDAFQCLEFCPHSLKITCTGEDSNEKISDSTARFLAAGMSSACLATVPQGTVPNQQGQWTSGRSNWCPGNSVRPLILPVSDQCFQVSPGGLKNNAALQIGLTTEARNWWDRLLRKKDVPFRPVSTGAQSTGFTPLADVSAYAVLSRPVGHDLKHSHISTREFSTRSDHTPNQNINSGRSRVTASSSSSSSHPELQGDIFGEQIIDAEHQLAAKQTESSGVDNQQATNSKSTILFHICMLALYVMLITTSSTDRSSLMTIRHIALP